QLAIVDLARFLRQLPGKALPRAARGTVEKDPGSARPRLQRFLRVHLQRRVERKRGALYRPGTMELRGLQTNLACDPKHLGKLGVEKHADQRDAGGQGVADRLRLLHGDAAAAPLRENHADL